MSNKVSQNDPNILHIKVTCHGEYYSANSCEMLSVEITLLTYLDLSQAGI